MNKNQNYQTKIKVQRRILKTILNLWAIITLGLFILDFFSGNRYDSLASSVGVIYLAILGIYVSEKEYIRWHNHFISKFLGESFVVVWTAVMIMFVITAPLSEGRYTVPEEFAVVYASIIGVFAITRHSKIMKSKNNSKISGKKALAKK